MADRKTIKIFSKFLVRNNAYNKYCKNMLEMKGMDKLHISRWLMEHNTYSFLFSAFTWDNSRESRNYWSTLSVAWEIFLDKKYHLRDNMP